MSIKDASHSLTVRNNIRTSQETTNNNMDAEQAVATNEQLAAETSQSASYKAQLASLFSQVTINMDSKMEQAEYYLKKGMEEREEVELEFYEGEDSISRYVRL